MNDKRLIEDNEHLTDQLDIANRLVNLELNIQLNHVRKAVAPEQVRKSDGTWEFPECVDCGLDIPDKRLALGKIRCVYCQGLRERQLSR